MADNDVVKMGYVKRLKNQKRRFFVLRSGSTRGLSRLEYYENEKKFKSRSSPRKVFLLSECFSIKADENKHMFGIALFTKEEVVGLIAEDETDRQSWIKEIDKLMKATELPCDGPTCRTTWPVVVKPRGLGSSKNLAGSGRLGLGVSSLFLLKQENNDVIAEFEFVNIRRCGHTDCFFFMEVGRSACTGPGEVWMLTEDPLIAQNMHEGILGALKNPLLLSAGPIVRSQTLAVSEPSKRFQRRSRPDSAILMGDIEKMHKESNLENNNSKSFKHSADELSLGTSLGTRRSSLISKLLGPGNRKKDGSLTPSPRQARPKTMFIPSTRTPPLTGRPDLNNHLSHLQKPGSRTIRVPQLSSSTESLDNSPEDELENEVFDAGHLAKGVNGGVEENLSPPRPFSKLISPQRCEKNIYMPSQDNASNSVPPKNNFMKFSPVYPKRLSKTSSSGSPDHVPATTEEYVNMTFGRSPGQDVAYVNMRRYSYDNVLDSLEYMTMNIAPSESPEEHVYSVPQAYVNVDLIKDCAQTDNGEDIIGSPSQEGCEPEYVNMVPNLSRSPIENIYDVPRQEYVNVEPKQRKSVDVIRSHTEYVNIPKPDRRSSSPCPHRLVEYENCTTLDLNAKSPPSKAKNYVLLDFHDVKKAKQDIESPTEQKKVLQAGTSPEDTCIYATIDFAKSEGLKNAVRDQR